MLLFLGSSTAEHPAVNRRVVGSNPTRGAIAESRAGGAPALSARLHRTSWCLAFAYALLCSVCHGPVAQRLEQGTHNPLVVGSNPTGPTIMTCWEAAPQRGRLLFHPPCCAVPMLRRLLCCHLSEPWLSLGTVAVAFPEQHVRAISSGGERCLHTAEVTGSNPVSPTIHDAGRMPSGSYLFLCYRQCLRAALCPRHHEDGAFSVDSPD